MFDEVYFELYDPTLLLVVPITILNFVMNNEKLIKIFILLIKIV